MPKKSKFKKRKMNKNVYLDDELLKSFGFVKRDENNHLSPWIYGEDKPYRIICEKGYDETEFCDYKYGVINISCWKENENGVIWKRASVHGCLMTVDDLTNVCRTCEITDVNFEAPSI